MKSIMKTTKVLIVIWMITLKAVCAQEDTPIPYFGQKPPGLIPEIFAQGIISLDQYSEASITFSPDMKELFFARRKSGESHNLYTMKWTDGQWSNAALAPFSTNKEYLDFHPRFSPRGDRLYFGSTRPLGDESDSTEMQRWRSKATLEKLHLWYVERSHVGWGQPIPLIEKPFEGRFIMCATPSGNGNLYFTSKEQDDKLADEGIYVAKKEGGEYNKFEKLSDMINGHGKWIAHPFVAPDESYVIYDAERSTGEDNGDLYVSFHKNGRWSESYSLGPEINTGLSQGAATVSPDGKFLFFRSAQEGKETSSLFWVSTAVIDRLRPAEFRLQEVTYEIAYASKASGDGEVYLTDKEGKSRVKITDRPGNDGYAAWSPDGTCIAVYAYHDGRKTWSIHTMNSDGSNRQRLTHAKNKWDSAPAWSPDGQKIVFGRAYSDEEGVWRQEIWIMNADGSEQKQLTSLDGGGPSFTPDGRIVFHSTSNTSEICIANQDGSNRINLTNNDVEDWHPEVSSDGSQIAFMSNRDGNHEIYVMNIDGSNPKRLTHNEVRDSTPTWSPDGTQLLFVLTVTDDERHIYKMNKDGTGLSKFIENAGSPAWLRPAR